MDSAPLDPEPRREPRAGSPEEAPSAAPKSYGNMSEHHWSRTRGERNSEAIEYYRARSHAPGVASGGAARNSYCMQCDGVIPWDGFAGGACPHCGASLEGNVRRFFNWVEIDRPPASDLRSLWPWLAGLALAAGALGWLLFAWIA